MSAYRHAYTVTILKKRQISLWNRSKGALRLLLYPFFNLSARLCG